MAENVGGLMEEISLREIIEIILKGKWIIAVITAICVILAAVWSFFILESTYEAQTMMMVSPIATGSSKITEDDRIGEIVAALSRYPGLTADTYKEQVKAPEVLQYVKDEAGLEMTLEQLGKKIDVEAIEKTNIITISVKDRDPELAARIANIVSEKFTAFVSETNRKQAQKAAEFIKAEQDREKVMMDEAHEKLKNFLALPRGPEELRLELNSKLSQLTSYKNEINSADVDLKIEKESLAMAESLIAITPMYIKVDRILADNNILLGIVRDATGKPISEIAGIAMTEEQVNPVYVELAGMVNTFKLSIADKEARVKSLQEAIASLQNEIEDIQAELAEKQKTYDQLQHEYNLVKKAYDAYRENYKEAMIMQSAEYGKSSIVVVSEAVPPDSPVAPNKKLNVAIAFVLGIMVSVFFVFIREYWQTSGKELQEAKDKVVV
jgi:succinoglycan biosynthesis transport protein ExoP